MENLIKIIKSEMKTCTRYEILKMIQQQEQLNKKINILKERLI